MKQTNKKGEKDSIVAVTSLLTLTFVAVSRNLLRLTEAKWNFYRMQGDLAEPKEECGQFSLEERRGTGMWCHAIALFVILPELNIPLPFITACTCTLVFSSVRTVVGFCFRFVLLLRVRNTKQLARTLIANSTFLETV